jgi:hypothetical protein
MSALIVGGLSAVAGIIAGLLVGRKYPSLADATAKVASAAKAEAAKV